MFIKWKWFARNRQSIHASSSCGLAGFSVICKELLIIIWILTLFEHVSETYPDASATFVTSVGGVTNRRASRFTYQLADNLLRNLNWWVWIGKKSRDKNLLMSWTGRKVWWWLISFRTFVSGSECWIVFSLKVRVITLILLCGISKNQIDYYVMKKKHNTKIFKHI